MNEEMDGLEVTDCTRCPNLVDSRSQIVNGTGPEDAEILFVGEGPGANEDETGTPFIGRSGSVLDETLQLVGLDREDVRITNCVRCRPPDNRDPKKAELENCRGYLETEIDRLDPDVIVTLGKVPSQHLLGRSLSVTQAAGDVEEVRIGDVAHRVVVSVHPAATLYDRSQKETFEGALETAADLASDAGFQSSQRRLDGF